MMICSSTFGARVCLTNGAWTTALVFGKSHGISKNEAMAAIERIGLPSRPFLYPLLSLPAYPGLKERYAEKNPIAYDISDRGINLSCDRISMRIR